MGASRLMPETLESAESKALGSANTERPGDQWRIDPKEWVLEGGSQDRYTAEFWTTYNWCWLTLPTVSATQFAAPVRHSEFYIDDKNKAIRYAFGTSHQHTAAASDR